MNRIQIEFPETQKISVPIKYIMKNSLSLQPAADAPSIFQVAAHLDEFITAHPEFVVPLNQKMPFADLMMHPEKVEAALKMAEDSDLAHAKIVK